MRKRQCDAFRDRTGRDMILVLQLALLAVTAGAGLAVIWLLYLGAQRRPNLGVETVVQSNGLAAWG